MQNAYSNRLSKKSQSSQLTPRDDKRADEMIPDEIIMYEID